MRRKIECENDKETFFNWICCLDMIQVFVDAYNSRQTSWKGMGEIREWKNATDEIRYAIIKRFRKDFEFDEWKKAREFIKKQGVENK